jgi:endogenous inhibitor of DNA gyrase (YacG/DUF329 family)
MPTFSCPTCQRPVEWSAAAKWRPFCSERCRLIDLGAWLTEQHAIPGEDQAAEVSGESAAEPGTDDLPRH